MPITPGRSNSRAHVIPIPRSRRLHSFTAVLAAVILPLCVHSADGPRRLVSPLGRIEVTIELPQAPSANSPTWSAKLNGHPMFSNCRLGLELKETGQLLAGASVTAESRRSVDQTVPVLFGRADHAVDRFNEIRLTFENASHRRTEVVFRCYDDGLAFRYELPGNGEAVAILNESSSFQPADDPTAYVQYLENYRTSHEHEVATLPFDAIRRGALLDMPLTLAWAGGRYAAITEASLRHYGGMSLRRPDAAESSALVSDLTPRPDGTRVLGRLPLNTPWRVVLMADRAGALLESETIYCLNEPSAIGDASWIKPGKITFHWWNGDVYDGKPGASPLFFEMAQKYIDFCASNNIPTHSISSTESPTTPWYQQSKQSVEPGPDTDVTRPRPGFDLAKIRDYARSKNVRLWTWVHQGALHGRVEEAFAAFEKLGWTGMMVDFFDHDDQDSVELVESILQAAARHHIMIHLHGIWKPTGLERTYPNLMNHEGALNLEYLKWSHRCTPEHDLMMAFTRLIAGPMDYHLGGFRAVPRDQFKPQFVAPLVLGTRCHQLAMYVCFDNPNPMVADYPTAYLSQPGFDFIQAVPTWWDETRVLNIKPGELLVTVRRKGRNWYAGGLAAKQTQRVELPLSFMSKGTYQMRLWQDAPESPDPNQLKTERREVSPSQTITIPTAVDGGFVAQFVPN